MISKKYRTTSNIDRQRLITAFNSGEDWITLSAQLNINFNTAKGIIKKWNEKGEVSSDKRGGYKKKILSELIGNSLLNYVENNNLSTLIQMKEFIYNTHAIAVSTNTIARYLDGKLLTIKLVRDVPANRNSAATKDKRFDYVKLMLDNVIPFERCIYIDESGFNLWLRRSYGRSNKGDRCFRTCHGQRGLNVSLCMAISTIGIVHSKIILGAFNSDKYQEFIEELSMLLEGESFYFIMDNCRIHNNVTAGSSHNVTFLPPYSPFMNPIEAVFSQLKSKVKIHLNSLVSQSDLSAIERRQNLMRNIELTIEDMRFNNFENFYRHCASYYVRCIQREY